MSRSRVFFGLVLAVDALLAGNLAEVWQRLQAELHTEAHTAFIQQIQGAAGEHALLA